eukprot:CAMPEP_0115694152 /NCGR_PEP_ID=MMETSP0272-20121206/64097_1 /TAXON_ID=71861 /ORGANISM="Scrippsiella trochoidea, Strain CCMP3099" /LENGTH=39 /DNA_ID= /DNA_START= /DNA_END= /DNA_ORIENTATION=
MADQTPTNPRLSRRLMSQSAAVTAAGTKAAAAKSNHIAT